MHRVFISSTSKDLTAHREAARDAVLRLGMHPVMMEHFPAMDADAIEACRRKVLDCDLFVGIYAHRYGYTPMGHSQSITEMEYEWAKAAALPRHLFVVKPDYTWPAEFTDAPDERAQLEAFKARIGTGHVWSEFTTPDSLAAAITQSLVHDVERLSREQTKQRRIQLASLGAVVLLILGVIVTLILTRADEKKIGISQADRAATNQAVAQANASATATLWTPTPTPTPTFTPSNTPTPTATPLEGAIAGEGETLLLIADFTYIDADATRIEPNLEREFEDIGLRFVRIHHPILDRDEAREILATYNATLILWGEAARGGVQVEFEARAIELSFTPIQFDQLRVAAFEVNSFDAYIFAGMDSRYIVEFTLGRILYSEEKYDDALEAFDRAVALIPEGRAMDVQAGWLYTLRGRSYEELGDHAAALVEYDTAASLLPDWGGPLTFAASAASFAADFEGAISRATQALDIGLDTPLMDEADVADFEILAYVIRSGAHHYLYVTGDPRGDIEQAKADMDAAIALAEGLRAIDPDYVTADLYAQRAGIWELMGNREAALADYDTALEQMPDSAAIYIMRGIYYHIAEEYDLALADFSRAIELDPNDADAFRNRASTYIDVEEWDLALSDINRSIELDPTYGANYGYRANIYYSLGQYEAAIADFTTTLDLTPDFTDVERAITYAARGAAYLQMGNFEASLSDFDQAITLRPTAFNYVRRGLAHTGLGDYNAALRDFSSAIELDETNDLAYYFRARLYVDQYQDCEKAEADSARLAELGASDAALDQDIATLCHPPSPTPLPQNAPDPMFENGATITLTSPLPLIVLAEPTIAAAQLGACTAGTTVTAQQTIITSDGRRWVEIDCQGVVGWVEEAKLPKP